MSIRIDGGVVVGWSGTSHEIVPNGSVLIDGNTVKSVSTDKSQSADRVIDAIGKNRLSRASSICTFTRSSTSATICSPT